jgi:HEPN domain-containing protein
MNALTVEWVDRAEQDFEAALRVTKPGEAPLTEIACFHCQQCAEKYLKAFLIENNVAFKRIHFLSDHLQLCLGIDPTFTTLSKDLASLEIYAVKIRYPGLTATAGMAQAALAAAARVRTFIRARLGL